MNDSQTPRQVRLVLGFASAGALIGFTYSILGDFGPAASPLRGTVTGGLIAGGIVAFEVALRVSATGARARRLAFVPFVLLRAAAWVAWILVVLAFAHALLATPGVVHEQRVGRDIAFSLAASLLLVIAFEIDRLLGPGTLWRLLTGRYHTPRIEDRAFMLLDIVGSTAIAERIGPAGFLALLDRLISDLTPAIAAHRGEIYRYVGDAIIVTWPLARAVEEARIVRCVAAVGQRMAAGRETYRREFGVVPEGRAALHAGPVAIGEIGDLKREITFLGDTLNTAARLEKICGELGRRVVISQDLLSRVALPAGIRAVGLGARPIAGRAQPVILHALEFAPPAD